MKIAKLKTTDVQETSQGILDNYYAVQDTHVFDITEDDVTSVTTLSVFNQGYVFDYQVFRDSLMTNIVPQWANILY